MPADRILFLQSAFLIAASMPDCCIQIPLLLFLYDALKPKFDKRASPLPRLSSSDPIDDSAILFDLYGRRKADAEEKIRELKE